MYWFSNILHIKLFNRIDEEASVKAMGNKSINSLYLRDSVENFELGTS